MLDHVAHFNDQVVLWGLHASASNKSDRRSIGADVNGAIMMSFTSALLVIPKSL